MLDNNWILNLASVIVAGAGASIADLPVKLGDPIGELINQGRQNAIQQVAVERGWIAIDGLPNESLGWSEVDADIIYAVRVTNESDYSYYGSELELIDFLPDGIRLNTNDFDGAGPIQTSFEFIAGKSGLKLLSDDVQFSSDGGETFSPKTKKGSDYTVGAIRISPRGTMAKNSSFTVRFRAKLP